MRFLLMAALCAATLSGVSTAVADHNPGAAKQHPRSNAEAHYLVLHRNALDEVGVAAGRNIVKDGFKGEKQIRHASLREVRESIVRLLVMLHPPAPEVVVAPEDEYIAEAEYSGGGYSIPSYIVECESGGDYAAENPSGAYGAYQIMPETASSYGCDLSSVAGQDACAAEIYADQGSAPWVCG